MVQHRSHDNCNVQSNKQEIYNQQRILLINFNYIYNNIMREIFLYLDTEKKINQNNKKIVLFL